jgi:cyanate permease
LDLIPEKIAAVAGLRGMFRVTGGVMGTAVVVLLLSHYQDKGVGFQQISLLFGFILLLIIPVVFLIPDSADNRRNNREIKVYKG